jgi:hypothetical protein
MQMVLKRPALALPPLVQRGPAWRQKGRFLTGKHRFCPSAGRRGGLASQIHKKSAKSPQEYFLSHSRSFFVLHGA